MVDIDGHACDHADRFAKNILLRVAMGVEIIVSFMTLSLLAVLGWNLRGIRVTVHQNLKVIFCNILMIYLMISMSLPVTYLRFEIVYLIYDDPCDFRIHVAAVIISRSLCLPYASAFPLWHLAITADRMWATHRPRHYEKSGSSFAWTISFTIWVLSLSYIAAVFALASEDPAFQGMMAFPTMTTATNLKLLIPLGYLALTIDVCTTAIDFVLMRINIRRIRRLSLEYSLSRNYQINENIVVTTRLVFPLDVCNAFLYITYMCTTTVLRYAKSSLADETFFALMELNSVLTLSQAPLSLLIGLRYLKNARRKVHVHAQADEADVYFRNFRQLVGYVPPCEQGGR